MLILFLGCRLAELLQNKNKKVEGWFKFSVQISLLELVYNTKHFCTHWLFVGFTTKNTYCSCFAFPKCWITDVKCWSKEYFGILCIIHHKHYPLLSTVDAVPSVKHGESFTAPAFSPPSFIPSWVGYCPSLSGGRGRCKVGHMETPPLTHDRQLVEERVSNSERDLAVFLGAPAYFWLVRSTEGGIICDFISFHSGKGEVSVIHDSWRWEHKHGPSFYPPTHISL